MFFGCRYFQALHQATRLANVEVSPKAVAGDPGRWPHPQNPSAASHHKADLDANRPANGGSQVLDGASIHQMHSNALGRIECFLVLGLQLKITLTLRLNFLRLYCHFVSLSTSYLFFEPQNWVEPIGQPYTLW